MFRQVRNSLQIAKISRLVLKPNCIKVPKEICVEAKVNPRKVSWLKSEQGKLWKNETHKLISGEEAGDPGMVLQTIRPSVAIIPSHTFSNAFQSQLETFNLDLQMFQHLKLNGASHTMNQQKTDLTFYNWKRVNRLG